MKGKMQELWDKRQHFNQRRWGKDIEIEKGIETPKKIIQKILTTSIYHGLRLNQRFESFALNTFLGYARKYQIAFKVKGKTFLGDEMFLVYPEFVSVSILRHGYYEEGLTEMVLEKLKHNMTFCDIGAHFGYYSLLASHIVGTGGQVHSFEPTPSTFSMLQENTTEKGNITINNCALYSRGITIPLADHGPLYSGHNSVTGSRCNLDVLKNLTLREIDVQAITFDQYVYDKGIRPDFVKIDVESAEYEVLRGMRETLKDIRPILSLEVGDKDLEDVKPSRELVLYLLEYGYNAYEYNGSRIVKHELKERYTTDNLLFLPK